MMKTWKESGKMSGSYDRVMEERKRLVDRIIENMKQGYVLPKPDWNSEVFLDTKIRNPVSGARYRGANLLRLYLTGLKQGYTDGRWVTYKQAQSEGWQVRKGEKGVRCEKYIFTKQVEEKNPETGETEKKTIRLNRPMVNTFVVFNASQVDGMPEQEPVKILEPDEILEMAERFQESSLCPIHETQEGSAYYSIRKDEIILPDRNAFLDSQSFLATQLHEMIHSTGHPDRLNRSILNRFGSPEYALEELRAELGSFFIQSDMNLQFDTQHFNSHTQYLESWIKVLKNDPNELFRAIADAQKACDFLEERYHQRELIQQRDLSNAPKTPEELGVMEDFNSILIKEQKKLAAGQELLNKQQEAAVRMAVKHEEKELGSGKAYLERWIEKDILKRQELKLPLHYEEMDYMRKSYEQLASSLLPSLDEEELMLLETQEQAFVPVR